MSLHDRVVELLADAHKALDEVASRFDDKSGAGVQAAHDALLHTQEVVLKLKPKPDPEPEPEQTEPFGHEIPGDAKPDPEPEPVDTPAPAKD